MSNLPNEVFCPFCNAKLVNATCVSDKNQKIIPNESLSICATCGESSIYVLNENNILILRKINEEEYKLLDENMIKTMNQAKEFVESIKAKWKKVLN